MPNNILYNYNRHCPRDRNTATHGRRHEAARVPVSSSNSRAGRTRPLQCRALLFHRPGWPANVLLNGRRNRAGRTTTGKDDGGDRQTRLQSHGARRAELQEGQLAQGERERERGTYDCRTRVTVFVSVLGKFLYKRTRTAFVLSKRPGSFRTKDGRFSFLE